MKQHEDTWASFALTGDPMVYLKYKNKQSKSHHEKEVISETN